VDHHVLETYPFTTVQEIGDKNGICKKQTNSYSSVLLAFCILKYEGLLGFVVPWN